jgi:hypothetical protein
VYTRYGDWFVVACGVWALITLLLSLRCRQRAYAFVARTKSKQPVPLSFPFVERQPGREQKDAVEERAG